MIYCNVYIHLVRLLHILHTSLELQDAQMLKFRVTGRVAGATCGAGDAHLSGTPDLTLCKGPLCLLSELTEFASEWTMIIG